MSKLRRIVFFLLLPLMVGTLVACNPLGQEDNTAAEPVSVERGNLTVAVSGSGNIETAQDADLTFGSGGRVAMIAVQEGDEVARGDVLARLDTDPLQLAVTRAEQSLAQAKAALRQAELGLHSAEYELKQTREREDALGLALLQAQISRRQAEHHLDETRDIYTWPDIETAKKDVEAAKAYVEYVTEMHNSATTPAERQKWFSALQYAQARLTAAEAKLDAMVRSYDTEEVAIARMQVEAAVAAEDQAQKNLDDLEEQIALGEMKVSAARASVSQAEKAVELALETLVNARKDLDEATIEAPFSGVVAGVFAKDGDLVPSPTAAPRPVIRLIDPTTMELMVEVDEIDIPEVRPGQDVRITLDALPGREFSGAVAAVYPVPRELGGVVVYDVKIEFAVPEGVSVRVGMSASSDIILARRENVLLVPSRAIREDSEDNTYVTVPVNGETEKRPVVPGVSDGFMTEIVSGLQEGDTILERGQ